jgi:type I restriction enzyme R subunit
VIKKCYYIPKLLATLKKAMTKLIAEKRKFIDLITGEYLRSKRELIEKFILENLTIIEDMDTIPEEFDKYWNEEQTKKAFNQLVRRRKTFQ